MRRHSAERTQPLPATLENRTDAVVSVQRHKACPVSSGFRGMRADGIYGIYWYDT